jgi:aerobic carbon-monoxide dehydrogenase medium subunit
MTALHDGTLHVQSRRGTRDLAFSAFAAGYMSHSLAPDELLTGISLKAWSPRHGHAFLEVSRRQGDFAIAAVSALVEIGDSGTVRRAAVTISGLGPIPIRPTALEHALLGQRLSHEVMRAAAAEAGALEAMSDAYVTSAYRQHLARILTYRALERAAACASERTER